MSLNDLLAIIRSNDALLVFLSLVLYGGYKGWWVWGRELKGEQDRHSDTKKQCEIYEELAYRGTSLAEAQLKARGKR